MDDINQIVALYLALQPLPTTFIAKAIVDEQSQRKLIDQIIKNPHLIAFPPAPECQKKFWKSVVAVLEEKDLEIEDEIYEHLISTLDTPVRQGPPATSYLTYLLRRPESSPIPPNAWRRPPGFDNFSQDHRPLTILESRSTIERGTTGLRTWRASLDLAEWLLQNTDIVTGARILELGSGTGLLGLLVATLQRLAWSNASCDSDTYFKKTPCIYLTDVDDDVLARCSSNLHLPCNMLQESSDVHVRALDWTDAVDQDRQEYVRGLLDEIDPDVVLAADVVYDPSIIPPLTRTLRLALERPMPARPSSPQEANKDHSGKAGQRIAYVALTLRREQTFAEFLSSVEAEGIIVDFVDMALPPDPNRVFRGSDDSSSAATDTTRLMRLTVPGVKRQTEGV